MGRIALICVAGLALGGWTAGDPVEPLSPGRYCSYEPVDTVSPPGEIWMRVIVEQRDGAPFVSFITTWPHSGRILEGEGPARAGADGVLRFDFEDGWGNHSEGRLAPDGAFELEPLGPAPDDWANSVRTYMYSSSQVSAAACRPADLRD